MVFGKGNRAIHFRMIEILDDRTISDHDTDIFSDFPGGFLNIPPAIEMCSVTGVYLIVTRFEIDVLIGLANEDETITACGPLRRLAESVP